MSTKNTRMKRQLLKSDKQQASKHAKSTHMIFFNADCDFFGRGRSVHMKWKNH